MYTNAYATGGRLKRGKMVIAHFNPQELNGLDYLQGKKETCPRSGMRSYSHLEELLKNPHIQRKLIHNVESMTKQKRQHRAIGGGLHDYHNAHLNEMADKGIRGDNELALIGPQTEHTLNNLLAMQGYPVTSNPQTGHPHYGMLDGLLGGLSGILSSVPIVGPTLGKLAGGIGDFLGNHSSSIVPAISTLAQKALPAIGERLGGDTGRNMANMANQAINTATQNTYTPDQMAQGQQLANQASQLGQQAYNSYQQGGMQGMARNLGGQALNQMGQYAGGDAGQFMGQMGQDVGGGQSLMDIARNAGRRAMPMMQGYAQQAYGN